MRILRVFPRRTAYTPRDDHAFVGAPPLLRPEADEVHVSVAFTWDIAYGWHLLDAWTQCYPGKVFLGGPAFNPNAPGYPTGKYHQDFIPGRYVKPGITFTSRGCDGRCSWCLVPDREGRLRLFDPIPEGHVIQDNNFLSCPTDHRRKVYAMLAKQKRYAVFAGGLQASLVTDEIAAEFRDLGIDSVFLAADTEGALKPLEKAISRLQFLGRRKLRCYMLLGYGEDTVEDASKRLEAAWQIGVLPFAQLYQPADRWINWPNEWRALAKAWSRPAATYAMHKETRG